MNIAILGFSAVSAVASVGCLFAMGKMAKELKKAKAEIDKARADMEDKKKIVRQAVVDLGVL